MKRFLFVLIVALGCAGCPVEAEPVAPPQPLPPSLQHLSDVAVFKPSEGSVVREIYDREHGVRCYLYNFFWGSHVSSGISCVPVTVLTVPNDADSR